MVDDQGLPRSGEWYYAIRCRHCLTLMPVAEDRSQGTDIPIPFPANTPASLTCGNAVCGRTDTYLPSEAVQVRAP